MDGKDRIPALTLILYMGLIVVTRHHVAPNFKFVIATGIENLVQSPDLYLKNAAAYGVIGVVVDADTDADIAKLFMDWIKKLYQL